MVPTRWDVFSCDEMKRASSAGIVRVRAVSQCMRERDSRTMAHSESALWKHAEENAMYMFVWKAVPLQTLEYLTHLNSTPDTSTMTELLSEKLTHHGPRWRSTDPHKRRRNSGRSRRHPRRPCKYESHQVGVGWLTIHSCRRDATIPARAVGGGTIALPGMAPGAGAPGPNGVFGILPCWNAAAVRKMEQMHQLPVNN